MQFALQFNSTGVAQGISFYYLNCILFIIWMDLSGLSLVFHSKGEKYMLCFMKFHSK